MMTQKDIDKIQDIIRWNYSYLVDVLDSHILDLLKDNFDIETLDVNKAIKIGAEQFKYDQLQ